MPSISQWAERIKAADKYYESWENTYYCKTLERYYRGMQWNINVDIMNYKPYVLNMFYSTIKIKMAGIFLQRPKFIVDPKPGRMNWNQEFAVPTAQLKQDTLNTIIENPKVHLVKNVKLAALDSFFRFGIVEVGYAADWTNPNKQDLITKSYEDENVSKDKDSVILDLEVPENERLYFKRINAKRFRVSTADDAVLDNCHWYGYYSYMLRSTLEKTKGIQFPKDYISNNFLSEYNSVLTNFKDRINDRDVIKALQEGQVCKVWNIWDNRKQEKLLLLEDANYEQIFGTTFERVPHSDCRWDDELEGWYPIPPAWQWISPQNEINEAREQMRNYRRRFIRKFWALKGAIDSSELDKMISNIDGEVIIIKRAEAIGQIPNPELGVTVTTDLGAAMNDLNLITGTSANARQAVDRTTATESKIIDMRSQIRESVEQMDFSTFVISLGREGLNQIIERFSEGMYIRSSVDPGEEMLGEIQAMGPVFKYITSQDLNDGYDADIDLDVTNATPQKMQEEKAKFLEFLTLTTQFPQLALSPRLLREAAYRLGYRNERIIKEIQQAAILRMMSQAKAMSGQNGSGATPESIQGSMDQNTKPQEQENIDQQMTVQ